MIKVSEPTIQDEFKKSILQNPISDAKPERQAEIVLSRVRLALLQGFPVSSWINEKEKIPFELGKGHWDNSYIAKLPLPLIKASFAAIAQDSGIPNDEIQSVIIVKQPGFLRDKVIVHMPNEAFMDKMTSRVNASKIALCEAEKSNAQGLSPQMS